jgi:hypothetical protein
VAIYDVIKRARSEPPYAPPDLPFPDTRLVCKVLDPIAWDRGALERELRLEIPSDLVSLWDACGGMILYEDNKFQQWGLVVVSPTDVLSLNREYHEDKGDRALPGDMVFARFWGDRERALIRGDGTAADAGEIVIVSEMGPRSEWDFAARSLESFLVGFMDAHGEKYWEYHYQKALRDRAAKRPN